MFITHPLVDGQTGQTMGVLAGRLDTTTLGQIMTERTGLGEAGETYLVNAESSYLVTPSRFESEGYIPTRAYHSQGIDQALTGEDGFGIYDGYRDPPVQVIGLYRWLPELQVAMLAEIDKTEALASFTQARNFSIILALTAALEGTKGVDAGAQRSGQTGETIQQLAASIGESARAAQQIVASTRQQSTGMEQIALAMQNINQATMQNLASIRQAEQSAQDLSSVAR